MIKVLVDTRVYLENTGLGNYIQGIVTSLSNDTRFKVYTYGKGPFHGAVLLKSDRSPWRSAKGPLRQLITSFDIDIYICPHFNYVRVPGAKNVVVLHDITPLLVKKYLGRLRWLKLIYIHFAFRCRIPKSDLLLTVSRNTKSDLITHFGLRNIEVCYPGDPLVNNGFRHKIDNQYLYVGDSRPHKNLERMIEIWNKINEDGVNRELLLVGNIVDLEYTSENINVLSKVNDIKLDEIYWQSDGLFFLSENEGFGLPLIEASNRETKCIILNKSSLKEIAMDENTFRINCLDSIDYDRLRSFLSSDIRYQRSIYSVYNWNNFNEKLIDL